MCAWPTCSAIPALKRPAFTHRPVPGRAAARSAASTSRSTVFRAQKNAQHNRHYVVRRHAERRSRRSQQLALIPYYSSLIRKFHYHMIITKEISKIFLKFFQKIITEIGIHARNPGRRGSFCPPQPGFFIFFQYST